MDQIRNPAIRSYAGGSARHRWKPILEETTREVPVHVFPSLTIYLSLFLCLYLTCSICLSINQCSFSFFLSLYLSIYLSIYTTLNSRSLSIYLYDSPALYLSPSVYNSRSLPVYLYYKYNSLYLSLCFYLSL